MASALIVDGGHPTWSATSTRSSASPPNPVCRSSPAAATTCSARIRRSSPRSPPIRSPTSWSREAMAGRFGAFGEIGQQGGVLTARRAQGVPGGGEGAGEDGAADLHAQRLHRRASDAEPRAARRGVDAARCARGRRREARQRRIGHVCCLDDPKAEIAIALAKRGVFVGFDRVTIALVPDAQKATTIMAMVEAGHADHVLLSSDFSSARALKKNGGPGIAQTLHRVRADAAEGRDVRGDAAADPRR